MKLGGRRCPRCGYELAEKPDGTFRCTECCRDWHLELAPGKAPQRSDYGQFIAMRTKQGIARARAHGVKFGRPRKELDAEKILKLRDSNMSMREIAQTLGVSKTLIFDFLKVRKSGSRTDEKQCPKQSL
jgi:hypothetical protein